MARRLPTYRIGYATSGLSLHRLEDALRLLADLGYRGVFLTLDVHHLDPFQPELARRAGALATLLGELDLLPIVETGSRFLLDPRRKHHPTLLSPEGAGRREDFLRRAIAIARDLGAPCVSLWSGALESSDETAAWSALVRALERLLEVAATAGVELAFEPEPGMLVDTVPRFHELRQRLGNPPGLRLSLDCGHLLVTGEGEPHEVLLREKDLLGCVAIEDMRRGVHEHLPFGEGDLDLPKLVDALAASGFSGVVAVELGRHAHDGPRLATASRDRLRPLGVPFA